MRPAFSADSVQSVLNGAKRLGEGVQVVVAVGLVGSYARGAAGPTSDVDLVVLTSNPQAMLENDDWFDFFGSGVALIRTEDFGAIQERRLRLRDGLVVEVGIGRTSWAAVSPVDGGTRRVVSDGLVTLYDPDGLLGALVLAVGD